MFSKWLDRRKPRITETHGQDIETNSDDVSANRAPPSTQKSFADLYSLREYLGRGTCGSVRTCVSILTGEERAVKLVEKGAERIFKEIDMFRACGEHANIVRLLETFEDFSRYYLVFEKMEGQSLLQQINTRVQLSECQTAHVCQNVAAGLDFMHTKGLVHRDIKPGNLLCVYPHTVCPLKICDLDVAFKLDDNLVPPPSEMKLWSPVGSPAYMAPEVVNTVYEQSSSYNEKCDCWSLGGVLITCLTNQLPFNGDCLRENCAQKIGMDCFWCRENIFSNIQWSCIDYQKLNVSESCLQIVQNLMSKEPNERCSAHEVLSHHWVQTYEGVDDEEYDEYAYVDPETATTDHQPFFRQERNVEQAQHAGYLLYAYSRKVYVGCLPPDIAEDELKAIFCRFGPLNIEWPRITKNVYFMPKGYAYIIFENDTAVQQLIQTCHEVNGQYFLRIQSVTAKFGLDLQIRPWLVVNSNIAVGALAPCDPRKAIFLGRVPTSISAGQLFPLINQLFSNVCYIEINTDKYGYPKGAARVCFSTQQSYLAACYAGHFMLDANRRVEIKPYVMVGQICDECSGPYSKMFCPNVSCLQYYCDVCWLTVHRKPGWHGHTPIFILNCPVTQNFVELVDQ